MSLIDDVLIAVEDEQPIGINALGQLLAPATKQAVFSATGRLIKRKFLEEKQKAISITDKGKDYIYSSLDAIKKFEDHKRPFILVLFEIPENQKVMREKFRISMNNLGFGSLKRGIMIGAITDRKEIEDIVRELSLEDRVIMLKTEFEPSLTKGKFSPWNFRKINQNYQQFMNYASRLLERKKDDRTRLQAKQLVLQFARTCKIDPVLPNGSAQDYLGKKAYELYNKLKPLCY